MIALCCAIVVSLPLSRASATAGVGLTDDEQAALLSRHNDARAQYGTPPLAWDDSLAMLAGDWANQLAAGDGTLRHRPNNRYGENIYAAGPPGSTMATSAVDDWLSEAQSYNLQNNTCSAVCGHFTQVVWSTTTRVGCGKASGAGWDFIVCDYDPAGNFAGRAPGITLMPQAAATTPAVVAPAAAPAAPAAPQSAELGEGSCSTPVKSTDASQAATIVFANQTAGTVYGFWIDYSGTPQQWFSLAPGETLAQETYVTHPWAITNAAGSCMAIYVAVPGTSQATSK